MPKRLVIGIDGIPYADLVALQRAGCFKSFFPVSRMISTFPSASDVAWTELFGGRAPTAYQRTHYNPRANLTVLVNPLTSSLEYETRATWRLQSPYHFAMSYIQPVKEFRHELQEMSKAFLSTEIQEENYYALILSTDSAQHMGANIRTMLRAVDAEIADLCELYQARQGRRLEVLIMSDHGNNHAGRGKRFGIKKFLKQHGYRVVTSIRDNREVALPTVGIESWVEVHNMPSETEALMRCLSRCEGLDVITGRVPDNPAAFMVMDSLGHSARIERRQQDNVYRAFQESFRYAPVEGDPLGYAPVLMQMREAGQVDKDGYANAEAWLAATVTNRYPVALERIYRGHTRIVQNPATILISLKNGYVHASWLVNTGSRLMKSGGTHGALDDRNSTGILLSNFARTQDTTANRMAAQFDGFQGMRNSMEASSGAEWISIEGEARASHRQARVNWLKERLPDKPALLHVWSPSLRVQPQASIQVTVRQTRIFPEAKVRRSDPELRIPVQQTIILSKAVAPADPNCSERVYELASQLCLEARKQYQMSGRILGRGKAQKPAFQFTFYTDAAGQPIPYLQR